MRCEIRIINDKKKAIFFIFLLLMTEYFRNLKSRGRYQVNIVTNFVDLTQTTVKKWIEKFLNRIIAFFNKYPKKYVSKYNYLILNAGVYCDIGQHYPIDIS